jgi:hypothetical protein
MAISGANINFKNMTIQSEKYVVVRETDKKKIAIITCGSKRVKRLQNTGNPPIDQAIMNPTAEVVALRSGKSHVIRLPPRSYLPPAALPQPRPPFFTLFS